MNFLFIYIKIPENSSARYYQENKERLQKKLVEDIKVFLKKKKKKCNNEVVKDTKSFQNIKKICWLSIEKKCYKMRKITLL